MSFARRLSGHVVRFQQQLGKKVTLGSKSYAVKGYISNILTVDADWEDELDDVFVTALSNKGYFIDVGMNLGQTLGKVLAIDPNRQYLGFEPQVLACALVDNFIKENRLNNCAALAIGLSNENGIKSFFSNGSADTMASLHSKVGAERSSIQVRVGDEVIEEFRIEAISAIKIDVEGAEPEVLEGLSGTIKRFAPQIIFEVLPNYKGDERTPVTDEVAEQRRKCAVELMRIFNELEYDVYQVLRNGSQKYIKAFELDDPLTFEGTNFVARPTSSKVEKG